MTKEKLIAQRTQFLEWMDANDASMTSYAHEELNDLTNQIEAIERNERIAECITENLIAGGYVPNTLNYPSSVENKIKKLLTEL